MPVSLHWSGRAAALAALAATPVRALEPLQGPPLAGREESLLLEADALEALVALRPAYAGTVALCYLDPPYNTGRADLGYDDTTRSPAAQAWLERSLPAAELKAADRSERWLSLTWPRIAACLPLLAADGVLALSLDGAELGPLLCLLDEALGRRNRLGICVWRTRAASNDASYIASVHEYVVFYARDRKALRAAKPRWRLPRPAAVEALAEAERLRAEPALTDRQRALALRAFFRSQRARELGALLAAGVEPAEAAEQARRGFDGLSRYRHFDSQGPFRAADLSWPGGGGPRYEVLHPRSGLPVRVPSRGWAWKQETMQARLAAGAVLFGADESSVPAHKLYLSAGEGLAPTSILSLPARPGVKELQELVPEADFAFPKPLCLLQLLVSLTTGPGELILDPFAGSGTTAHAVLALNAAEPEGPPRRFLLCESEVGAQVTVPRLERAIAGYGALPGLGGCFRRVRLGDQRA